VPRHKKHSATRRQLCNRIEEAIGVCASAENTNYLEKNANG
jgi:hypothetical protein